jgi:hypothetical protein
MFQRPERVAVKPAVGPIVLRQLDDSLLRRLGDSRPVEQLGRDVAAVEGPGLQEEAVYPIAVRNLREEPRDSTVRFVARSLAVRAPQGRSSLTAARVAACR